MSWILQICSKVCSRLRERLTEEAPRSHCHVELDPVPAVADKPNIDEGYVSFSYEPSNAASSAESADCGYSFLSRSSVCGEGSLAVVPAGKWKDYLRNSHGAAVTL